MRVKEVPRVITAGFFVSYFVLGNLCLLNLFIAAMLQKLKITGDEGATTSQAARAALVMKEALEAEAAEKDLEDAKLFLSELQADSASGAAEIAEAEQIVNDMAIVSAKETEESVKMDSTLKFFGLTSSRYTLGFFGPANPIRCCAQTVVHSNCYSWVVCVTAVASLIVPCLKGHISDFQSTDSMSTLVFGALLFSELMLKSVADGFLWVFPSVIQQHTPATVVPEDSAPKFRNFNDILSLAASIDAWHNKSHGEGGTRKRANLLQVQKKNLTIFRVLTMRLRRAISDWHMNSSFGCSWHQALQRAVDNWHANGGFPPRREVAQRVGDHNWTATKGLGQCTGLNFHQLQNAWWANSGCSDAAQTAKTLDP